MQVHFNYDKSLEASAYLLELEGHSMEYMRLIKLLYIAERELLAQSASPLTGDVCKAMEYGPVLSTVLDLIKDKNWRSGDWSQFIARQGHSVHLIRRPGRGNLSPCIIDKLKEVSDRYQGADSWDIVEKTHSFPEWIKNYPGNGGSAVIPLGDILEAQHAEEGTLGVIEEEDAIRRQMERIIEECSAQTETTS